MFRPRGFADLTGRRVGLWGLGVEGRAALERVRDITKDIVLVDDAPLSPEVRATDDGGLDDLRRCDIVLKSPGIPRRRADVLLLEDDGVCVTSALNLWLASTDRAHVIAVTGTKGKSTTTSLITFFLQSLGESAESAGNIGRPPYAVDFPDVTWTVLEVSSYQAVDLEDSPGLVVVTSLGADHLDWHGSLAQYRSDKLSLTRLSGAHVTLVADDATVREELTQIGGDLDIVPATDHDLTAALHLVGAHNVANVSLALAATARATGRSLADVVAVVKEHAAAFTPLPGRLTVIARDGSLTYVDDGLATAPLPTIAALEHFADESVALLAGGFDRGVDYTPLADALSARHRPTYVIVMDEAGDRIADAVRDTGVHVLRADTMDAAVRAAEVSLDFAGVVLLSPAAPSFGTYANWRERSDDFARAVGDRAVGDRAVGPSRD